jgi:hypothetical protein
MKKRKNEIKKVRRDPKTEDPKKRRLKFEK